MAEKGRRYGEGPVSRRQDGRWQVCVSINAKPLYRYAATEAEAEKIRRSLVAQKRAAKPRPDPSRLTLGVLLDEWIVTKEPPAIAPWTYENYERVIRLHVRPYLEAERVADPRPSDLQAWLRALAKIGLSVSVLGQARSRVSECLQWALLNGRVDRNSARGWKMPRAKPPVVRLLKRS